MPARALWYAVAALVIVGMPALAFLLFGTPELAVPSQWAEVETGIADGSLPAGYIVNLIAGLFLLVWFGGLGLLAAILTGRMPTGGTAGAEATAMAWFAPDGEPADPETEPDITTGASDLKPDMSADPRALTSDGSLDGEPGTEPGTDPDEPWYRQVPPLFDEPFSDEYPRVVVPPDDTTPDEAPGDPAWPAGASTPESPIIDDGITDAEIIGGAPGGADVAEPPMIVPVRAYYFSRSGDTLRSVSAQFLQTPMRWEELRSLNAASPGVAAVEADTLLPPGTALALPGDPLPWGKPDPVYLWTLAEKFLFTAWGREPTPEEVVPFWRGLTGGAQLEAGAPPVQLEHLAAPPAEFPAAATGIPVPPTPEPEPAAHEPEVPTQSEAPDQEPEAPTQEQTAEQHSPRAPVPPTPEPEPPTPEPEPPAQHAPQAPSHEPEPIATYESPPPPPAYESPVPPTHEPPPPMARQPGEVDLGPIEPEMPYVEAEAPRMPSFLPSLTGADTAATAPEAQAVTSSNRSLAGTAIGDAMMLWQLSRIRRRGSSRATSTPMEESLRQSARVDTLNLIEAAMRHLRAVTVGQLREKPSVLAVRVGTYGFEVLLNRPVQAPDGWQAASGGYVLELPQGVTADDLDTAGQGPTLCPALVPVGDTVEGPLLLNVEEIGCLIISGPTSPSVNLLNAVVGTLGSSPLAADIRIITVGVETPVGVPGWDNVHSTSFDSPQLEELISTAHTGRGASLDILAVGPGNDLLIQRAGQVASTPESRLALVGVTSSATARWPWRIHVDETTTAVVHPIACTMAAAQAMSPAMSDLLSEASDLSLLAPPRF